MPPKSQKQPLQKPKKHTREFYDWNEAVAYIEAKYNIDIRNYAGYKFDGSRNVPYQDFWHSICDNLHNGSYLDISADWGTEDYFEEEWERKIAQLFVDEFLGDADTVAFYVWW